MKKSSMKMVEKDGKKVPSFAADGVGKMKKGGAPKKMQMGGPAGGMPMQGGMPPERGPMPQGMPPAMKKGGAVGMHKMPDGRMMKNSDMGDKMGRAVKRKTADVKGRAMKKGV